MEMARRCNGRRARCHGPIPLWEARCSRRLCGGAASTSRLQVTPTPHPTPTHPRPRPHPPHTHTLHPPSPRAPLGNGAPNL